MERKSIESKKFLSPTRVKSDNSPKERALKIPRVQAIKPSPIAATYLFVLKDSTNQATPGSKREIAELKAAILSKIKNNLPNSKPRGIFTNAHGKVTKTRPGPEAVCKSFAKTIGNIAIPAKRATEVSKKATEMAVEPIFCLDGIYAPYAIIAPMPRLKVKKACPNAAKIMEPFIFEKSGVKR